MVSKIPGSSKNAFALIHEIIRMGEVEIPQEFNGAGAPGNTLEFLLDVEQNNFDAPDFHDWEIKFHGGNSLLTLFHKDPQPTGILNKMVDTFGWETEKGQISFRHTLSSVSEKGFRVIDEDHKIKIVNVNDTSIIPYWEHNTILNAIGSKLRRLILVHGKVSNDKRHVIYNNAVGYWDLNLVGIIEAIKNGTIFVDFDARTTKGKGTALRNHGTKFRIHINNIGGLYVNSQVII